MRRRLPRASAHRERESFLCTEMMSAQAQHSGEFSDCDSMMDSCCRVLKFLDEALVDE